MHRPLVASLLVALSFAASAQLVDSTPLAVTEEQARDGSTTLTHAIDVNAPADAVWTAIATPDGWRTWAVPFARVPDGEPDILETSYTSIDDASTTIRQRITERVDGRRIAFRTINAPDGFPNFETYRLVASTFDLTPTPDGRTQVRLTATGFADTEAGRQLLAFFRDGNGRTLLQLRERFDAGPKQWRPVRKP